MPPDRPCHAGNVSFPQPSWGRGARRARTAGRARRRPSPSYPCKADTPPSRAVSALRPCKTGAARRIAQTDHDRTRFVVDNFYTNPADPCHYDLVLNSARLGVEACADIIVETLRRVQAGSAARAAAPVAL